MPDRATAGHDAVGRRADPSAPPRRAQRADAARNRARLVEAAFAAFRRDGVGASLDDIARAAGVGPGTLYRHFPHRDDLVLAVIDDHLVALAESGTALLDAPDAAAALTTWLLDFIEQATTFTGLAATLAGAPTDASPTCHRVSAAGRALIERAVATGYLAPQTVATDVLDLVAAIAWLEEQTPGDGVRARRLLETWLAGASDR